MDISDHPTQKLPIQTPHDSDQPNSDHSRFRPSQPRPPNSDPSIQTPVGSELFKNVYVTQNRHSVYIYI